MNIEGNYLKITNDVNNLIDMLSKSYNKSIFAIANFINNLNIDSSLFRHLYNVNIIIDNTEKTILNDYSAFFRVNNEGEPEIHVSIKYINDLYNYGKINGFNESIYRLSRTIVHELIHYNRFVIIKDETFINKNNNLINTNDIKDNELDKKLDYVLTSNPSLLNEYCFILSSKEKNNYYEVIVYDNIKNSYYIFYVSDKEYQKYKNSDNEYQCLNRSNLVKTINNDEIENSGSLCCDYIKDKGKSNLVHDLVIYNNLNKQLSFEELLTESFSGLIIENMHKDYIDINELCDNLINSRDEIKEIKLVYKMIKSMGIDYVKWFILSCYQDEYVDYHENIFSEDYRKLLNSFNKIYEYIISSKKDEKLLFDYNSSLETANKIIEKKL